jgi:hypothetical protein
MCVDDEHFVCVLRVPPGRGVGVIKGNEHAERKSKRQSRHQIHNQSEDVPNKYRGIMDIDCKLFFLLYIAGVFL